MLSLQAVTLFQVVTKLINRNWFPVRFILKLLSALLVNRRKDMHYWFKLLHQQVKHMLKFTYAAVAGCLTSKTYNFVIFLHISVGEILKTINTQIRLVLTIVLHLSPTVLAIVYVFWEMVYSCIQNEGFQTFLPF